MQTDEEVMSQGHEQKRVMPAQPTARFIRVETDFAFAFLEDDF
jgi:hypothetical protein